jgi:hypothetical protein
MSTAPRSISTSTPRTAPTSDLARFLAEIFRGQEQGYVHLGYIAGDPARDKHTPAGDLKYSGWEAACAYADIHQHVRTLAQTHGDSYSRGTAFDRKNYDAAHALPSAVVFVDDPKHHRDSLSMVVQTSAVSVQGYFLLDRCYPPPIIRELQELAKNVMDGDPCHSIGHFVRVPGGYNTKHGARFLVRLATLNSTRYTADELRALFLSWIPPVAAPQRAPSTPGTRRSFTSADVTAFEKKHSDLLDYYTEHLAEMLETTDGVQHPSSFKTHAAHQGYRVCAGTLRIMNAAGTDLDYSTIRAAFVKSCRMHGYDDAATYVLALHVCQYRDPLHIAQIDTVRLIDWARALLPNVITRLRTFRTGTQQTEPPAPIPAPAPAVKRTRGRPVAQALDLDRFYAQLVDLMQHNADGEPIVMLTQQELADELHISRRKVGTLESGLRAAGRVGERTRAQRSYLPILLDFTYATNKNRHTQQIEIDAEPQRAVYSIPTLQTEQSTNAALKGTYAPRGPAPDPAPAGASGGYVPCDAAASPEPAPSLGEMVKEALDANGDGLVRRHMDTRTRAVARYIVDNFDGRTVDPACLGPIIKREQDRRKYAAAAAQLEALEAWQLKAQQRCYQGRIDRAMQAGKDKQARLWLVRVRGIDAEFNRRGLDPALNYRKPRKVRTNAPTLQPLPLLEALARDDSPDLVEIFPQAKERQGTRHDLNIAPISEQSSNSRAAEHAAATPAVLAPALPSSANAVQSTAQPPSVQQEPPSTRWAEIDRQRDPIRILNIQKHLQAGNYPAARSVASLIADPAKRHPMVHAVAQTQAGHAPDWLNSEFSRVYQCQQRSV